MSGGSGQELVLLIFLGQFVFVFLSAAMPLCFISHSRATQNGLNDGATPSSSEGREKRPGGGRERQAGQPETLHGANLCKSGGSGQEDPP